MSIPTDRKYAETHEWFKVDGDLVIVGISQFAADELTDITYVEVSEVGTQVEAGKEFGEVESVKATSELISAVSGEIIEVNPALTDAPELVNEDPYGAGWLLDLQADGREALEAGLGALLDAEAYRGALPE